jgi:uncharacterized membrane protein YbaN (DUF454 family)
VLKWLSILLGTTSIVTGLITFWLPIPIGLPLILIGLPLLMKHSPDFNRWTQQKGERYPRIGRLLALLKLRSSDKSSLSGRQ